KGIENLLRAFVDLEDNFALCIAGKGAAEYEEYLQQKYSHGKITWLGYINQEDFFSRIDVLVVPSIWYENLPTVIIEACNHGIPVIASNIGGIPELVKDGVNGFLCEYNNIEDLKKKMVHISGEINQWKKKALEIRKSATPFLNYDGWIVQWEKLILHVIHSN
ncbi:MAG: glycosyltransferase, partial [Spirochaetes bacterium]|nr:glycosyltransferase [Spirochaetota bacterium]